VTPAQLEAWGALFPNATLVLFILTIAEELRRRGQFDAANYCEKAANAMEG
jgi:hypothetical protein